MKIVLTGALGHIGSKLIRVLPVQFKGAEIVMIDNFATQRYASLFDLPSGVKYRFHDADVLSSDLDPIMNGADVVIHMAAITNAAGSFEIRDKLERENLLGTDRVARAAIKARAAMINFSSTSVYGTAKDTVDESCSEEDLKPQSPYAETKLREEKLLTEFGQKEGLRFVTCRFGTIFGVSPGMRFHTAVNKFCWQAVMGLPLTVWSTAYEQKRPYLDLKDAARAVSFVIHENVFDQGIYNVLTSNFTVSDIVGEIRSHIPSLKVQFVDQKIMNQLSYNVDNARFKRKGFEFSGDLKSGIADTIGLLRGANRNG